SVQPKKVMNMSTKRKEKRSKKEKKNYCYYDYFFVNYFQDDTEGRRERNLPAYFVKLPKFSLRLRKFIIRVNP
ncbi:MAG: hypothetical protein M3R36_07015, partial [Bacteroidota bacterium]|nr:hypothetical protein [Bacteroidota bacterium]